MCLIAYVPAGKSVDRENFDHADATNNDGIGVMSARDGIAKFVGKRHLKRARRYVRGLTAAGVEHAIHWRYATHGMVSRSNTHPFELPGQAGWLMHNGVLSQTAKRATKDRSDTALYTELLTGVPKPRREAASRAYWGAVERAIGKGNKFCVMHADGSFRLVNEDEGSWLEGIWYSNTYSLAHYDYRDWIASVTGRYQTNHAQTRFDRLADYGPKPVLPSGPTLDADGYDDPDLDLGEAEELWACRHGVPWSDFCRTCDGLPLPDFRLGANGEADDALMLRGYGEV